MAKPLYDFQVNTIKHEPYDMNGLKEKVVIIVNTASKCGFTSQLKGFEELHQEYKDKGLVILGFPCNQFGKQEPEGEEVIHETCQKNYGVTFQMMEKVDVNGDTSHPIFQWLKSQKKNLLMSRIKWNFEKFLLDKEGNVYARYGSITQPNKMKGDIIKLLGITENKSNSNEEEKEKEKSEEKGEEKVEEKENEQEKEKKTEDAGEAAKEVPVEASKEAPAEAATEASAPAEGEVKQESKEKEKESSGEMETNEKEKKKEAKAEEPPNTV